MKHAATVFMENLLEKNARKRAVEIARKLLNRGDSVDDVVDVTGLDLNDVLKLKGTM